MHKTTLNRIIALLAAALCFSAAAVPAFAEEGVAVGNFGEAEEQQQTAAEEQGTEEESSPRMIAMSNGFIYSTEDCMFHSTVGSGSFGISVPDNAIVTGGVAVTADTSLTCRLYLNGTEQTDAELSHITAPGKYVLAVSENDETAAVRVYFTIVNQVTGDVSEYRMPADFYVVSAKVNGQNAVYSQSFVDLTSEGDFDIQYRSPKCGAEYRLQITVDHTPPTLTLTGLTENKANGPVTISDVEEGAKVYITRNEKPYANTETLTETGIYTVTAKDTAGNLTEYNFVIVTYLNTNSWIFFIALAVMIIGLVAYLIYSRRKMRVR